MNNAIPLSFILKLQCRWAPRSHAATMGRPTATSPCESSCSAIPSNLSAIYWLSVPAYVGSGTRLLETDWMSTCERGEEMGADVQDRSGRVCREVVVWSGITCQQLWKMSARVY